MRPRDASATTRAAVEMTLVWAFVGIRSIDLVQAFVASGAGALRSSTNVLSYVLFLGAAVFETVALCLVYIRRRSFLPAGAALWVDVVFSALTLVGMLAYSEPEARPSSWMAWAFAFTLATAGLIGCTLERLRDVVLTSLGLAAVYAAVTVVPLLGHPGTGAATGFGNCAAYLAFAVVLWFFARLLRGLATEADDGRRRIAELERARSQAVVHDMLGYLRLDRLLEAGEATRAQLVQQALTKYQQMRAYVDGTDQPGDVEHCLQSVVQLFPALEVRLLAALEPPLRLDEAVAIRLRQAVETALANVVNNAPGARVVLTARAEARTLNVTIVDDGPGFDASTTRIGFGIAETLGRQLVAVGGSGRVIPRPGLGTEVHITVPVDSP